MLALDLMSKLGWACRAPDGGIIFGTETFRSKGIESAGIRWMRFRIWLDEINDGLCANCNTLLLKWAGQKYLADPANNASDVVTYDHPSDLIRRGWDSAHESLFERMLHDLTDMPQEWRARLCGCLLRLNPPLAAKMITQTSREKPHDHDESS